MLELCFSSLELSVLLLKLLILHDASLSLLSLFLKSLLFLLHYLFVVLGSTFKLANVTTFSLNMLWIIHINNA